MFLSSEEAKARIASTQRKFALPVSLVTKPEQNTTMASSIQYTDEEKVIIGTLAGIDGIKPTQRLLGIGLGTVETYAHGKPTRNTAEDPELKNKINNSVNKFREALQGKVNARLDQVIENITPAKIENVGTVKDLALIAGQLAKVAQTINPTDNSNGSLNLHYHVYRPRTRSEDEYEVIDVGEV